MIVAVSSAEKDRIRSEAAAWVARLDGPTTAADREEFERWASLNPAHRAAFDKSRSAYRQSVLIRQSPIAREVSLDSEFPSGRSRLVRAALAASVAGLLVLGGYEAAKVALFRPPLQAAMLTSGSSPMELTLEDGTRVVLAPASAIRIDLTNAERRAELRRGEARLAVASERRPFILKAGDSRVKVGEGRYRLTLEGTAGRIVPVEDASAVETALPTLSSSSDIAAGNEGTPSLLEFEAASLGEVAARANQVNASPVLEIDPRLTRRKVSGIFKSGDSVALGRSLAAALELELVKREPGKIRLEPRKK